MLFALALAALLAAGPAPPQADPIGWASRHNPRELVVDLVGFTGADAARVSQLIDKHPYDQQSELHVVPADDPLALDRYPVGSRYALVTTKGAFAFGITGLGVSPGASEYHYLLRAARFDHAEVQEGLVMPLTQRALQLQLHPLAGQPARGGELKRFATAFRRKLSRRHRRVLARNPLQAQHVRVYAGRFGAPGWRLVSVARKVDFTSHLSGLFFVDGRGRLRDIVVPPQLRLDRYDPRFVVDLDADGVDEIVLDADYYEGSYRLLLRLGAEGFEATTLTGDGA